MKNSGLKLHANEEYGKLLIRIAWQVWGHQQHSDNSQVNKTKVQTKKGQFKIGNNGGEVDIDNGGRHEVEV